MSSEDQNDDLTGHPIENLDFDLTDEELEELEEDLEHEPTGGATFNFRMLIGALEDEDEDEEDEEDEDSDPLRGWYDVSSVNDDGTQSIWFTPEAAQRLMDHAKATGITAEQAFGWLLLRAYGRAPQ
jgi:hypothetical protein